jgi:hypothetical protein
MYEHRTMKLDEIVLRKEWEGVMREKDGGGETN